MSSPSLPPEIDQTTLLFRSKAEEEWESRRNAFLEAHPYLVGYVFLAVPVVLMAMLLVLLGGGSR